MSSILARVAKSRPYGFTSDTSDAMLLHSTFDAHRYIRFAEAQRVSFDCSVPSEYVNRCLNDMVRIGAPVFGHEYACNEISRQLDSRYLDASLKFGRPTVRHIYTIVEGVRRVSTNGDFGMSAALMGPLSRFKELLGVTDSEWRIRYRFKPMVRYLKSKHVPFVLEKKGLYVNNVRVILSGHVLNYLLNTLFLATPLSRPFNLGSFRDSFLNNMHAPCESHEPTFTNYAWHSWLEVKVAIYSAIQFLFDTCHYRFYDKRAVKLFFMACKDFLDHIVVNKRTTITALRDGLRWYDRRYYVGYADIDHIFIVMPSGTGKSTLASRYPSFFVDIDDCVKLHKDKHKVLVKKAATTGDWDSYNYWWYRLMLKFVIDHTGPAKVFLIHHPEFVTKCMPNAPCRIFMLEESITIKRVVERDKNDGAIAKINWSSLNKYEPRVNIRDFKKQIFPDSDSLTNSIFEWMSTMYEGLKPEY